MDEIRNLLPWLGSAGAWVWSTYGKEIQEAVLKKLGEKAEAKAIEAASAAWTSVDWKLAARRYNEEIQKQHGTTRILGKPEPVSLEGIFTDVYILDRPTAFRRFDLSALQQDAGILEADHERVHGLDLVRADDSHRLFILGKPGAGKTTFLKYITLQAAQGSLDRLPIFVSLKAWVDSGLELMPFLVKQFGICSFPDAEPFVETVLERGKALVLFDGLDEVNQENKQREKTIASIRDFSYQYRKSQCLITCRIAATDYTFDQFKYVELADFSKNQIDSYVNSWFQHDVSKLIKFHAEFSKDENQGLRELAKVPLLLGLLCLSFDETMTFPQRRVEIYAEALDALLKKWDSSRSIKRDEIYRHLTPGRKSQMFARIAAQTFQKNEYFLPQTRLIKQIVSYLKQLPNSEEEIDIDGEAVLKSIEAQHGIFSERAARIYSFSHLTFQEYFTAKHIVEDTSGRALRGLFTVEDIYDARWREVILLTVSLLDDASFFFELFKKAIDNLIKNHPVIHDVLVWTQTNHENAVDGTTKVAVRAYNCYRILGLNLTSKVTRLRYFPHSYDLNRAITYAQNLDLSLIGSDIKDIQTTMGHVGGERYVLEQELHLSFKRERDPARVAASLEVKREHQNELVRARAQALARDQAAALAESLGATFVRVNTAAYPIQLKADVQISNLFLIADLLTPIVWEREINSLLRLKSLMEKVAKLLLETGYSIAASELKGLAAKLDNRHQTELSVFKEALLNSLKQARNIPEFELTQEQSETLSKYFAANRLFVESLRLAVIPNRQFTEESLLQLPK